MYMKWSNVLPTIAHYNTISDVINPVSGFRRWVSHYGEVRFEGGELFKVGVANVGFEVVVVVVELVLSVAVVVGHVGDGAVRMNELHFPFVALIAYVG